MVKWVILSELEGFRPTKGTGVEFYVGTELNLEQNFSNSLG